MLTSLGVVYLVGVGIYAGVSFGFAMIVTFFTLGSEDGIELAGKIAIYGCLTAVFWPVLIPYRVLQGKFGR